MRIIMSYITLFLTLEYIVILKMKSENLDWNQRCIKGDRFQYFQKLLASGPLTNKSTFTFRDHISYGHTYRVFGQKAEMASLLMLAVSGHRLMKIAKKTGPRSHQILAMAAALSSSQTWWVFAHTIGPCTRRILFSGRVSYTIPQLLSI